MLGGHDLDKFLLLEFEVECKQAGYDPSQPDADPLRYNMLLAEIKKGKELLTKPSFNQVE